MLEKLRSRHPIDLPAEEWRTSRGLLAVLGLIAVLFLGLPLLAALYAASQNRSATLAVITGVVALLVALALAGIWGKPGHARR